jgi:SH3-like domain-containing protein
MKLLRALLIAACLPALAFAQSFNFSAIGESPAILYDAPTQNGIKRYIAPRGMPVEVVHVSGHWSKVRDVTGEMNWVESRALGSRRTVVVTVEKARIRTAPDANAPLVFTADKGVVLHIAEPMTAGWVKIRHRDGQTGYAHVTEVWGA